MDLLENVEVEGQLGKVLFLFVAVALIFTFAYPMLSNALNSISDSTGSTFVNLALLSLVVIAVLIIFKLAGVA